MVESERLKYKKSKILLVSQIPPPIHGSTVMTQRFIIALENNKISSHLVQKTFSRNIDDVGKFSISKVLKIPSLCARLIKSILVFKPTITIYFITVGFGSFLVDCLMLLILRAFKIDYVLYMHGIGLRKWRSKSAFPFGLVAQKTLSAALGGIVLGDNLKQDVTDYIPADRIVVLPNAIPDNVLNLSDSKLNEEQLNDEQVRPVTVLFLSNLLPDKGPMNFLRAAKKVLEEEKGIKFVLAGPPRNLEFFSSLNKFIEEEGLKGHVYLPGGVYNEDKDRLFREADIFVFPAKNEAFGLVNLEAMQWGLPIVTSPVGAIPDVILDGENGYIVDPENIRNLANTVLRLVRNPELRFTMGRKGRSMFERKYSLDAFQNNTLNTVQFFVGLQER